jgi:hypothetical protein
MVQVYNSYHPTSIYQTSLDIDNNYRQGCIDEIYRLGDSMNYTTNVKALMTSYQIYEETDVFNSLLNYIFQKASICPWVSPNNVLKYDSVWGSIYKENEKTLPHNHGNSLVSFVLYLQTDQTSSPLKIHTSPEIIIYPKINDLIMFRGYVKHSVPPQPKTINNDRIVFAGNIIENK